MITSPMLACTLFFYKHVSYPCYASPKIDGIRCLKIGDRVVVGRRFLPLMNDYVRDYIHRLPFTNMDGELTVENKTFHELSGLLRSKNTTTFPFRWSIFDCFEDPNSEYQLRLSRAMMMVKPTDNVKVLWHRIIQNEADLRAYTDSCLDSGYEGVILRSRTAPYKSGRSTLNEFGMVKIKPFEDAEGTIVDFEEQMANFNLPTINAVGLTERSSHKENLGGANTLGALHLSWNGKLFRVGTGFSAAQRQEIWDNKDKYLNKQVTFKYQKHGTVDLPRSPVFKCFRGEEDLDV